MKIVRYLPNGDLNELKEELESQGKTKEIKFIDMALYDIKAIKKFHLETWYKVEIKITKI